MTKKIRKVSLFNNILPKWRNHHGKSLKCILEISGGKEIKSFPFASVFSLSV